MKVNSLFSLMVSILGVYSSFAMVSFVQNPAMAKTGGQWQITFGISEAADVEVSIVNLRDSSVVRHLAAGVLGGANVPAPLAANSLGQTLIWDGKDDFGTTVARPESLSVRVRAGMSARLDCFAGERLNLFPGVARASCGLIPGNGNSVFLQGKVNDITVIRQYDSLGNYLRTVFPPPASLPVDSVTSYGINVLPGGGWAPVTTYAFVPTITNALLNSGNAYLLPIGRPGELIVSDGANAQVMSEGGACLGGTRSLITSPAPVPPANNNTLCGPRYFTLSGNPNYLYLSGFYFGNANSTGYIQSACTTGFWADGQVFKVNRTTGVATPWLKLDSIPVTPSERLTKLGGSGNATAAVHGVAIDTLGHVFICDRVHRRISVYDTNAVLKGSVPVVDPDLVAISKRSGALYVVTRNDRNGMSLVKFAGWSGQAVAVNTIFLTASVDDWAGSPALVITENAGATNVWVGYSFGFRMYRDNGAGPVLVQDFGDDRNIPTIGLSMDRMSVDPKTETLYWGQGINFKISDWGNPTAVVCSTSSDHMYYRTGARVPAGLDDITISPKGYIYGYNSTRVEMDAFNTPIRRYKRDFSSPLPYSNTGDDAATCNVSFEGSGVFNKHRGMAIGWRGEIAVSMDNDPGAVHDNNAIYLFPDTGYGYAATSLAGGTPIITNLSSWSSGVKFDPAGNVYVGTNIHGQNWQPVLGFETDNYSTGNHSGSIVKYLAGTTGSVSGNTAIGAAKVYPQPYGTYNGGDYYSCVCRSPRFDVDAYGRIYIPFATGSKISVSDNSGNTILSFGQYGNTDARGGLAGPGQPYAEPAFPLAWPNMVAASEDYIYVGDVVNQRIMRVQKAYAIDNIPGLTDHGTSAEKAKAWKNLAILATPNPFNPVCRVTFTLPQNSEVMLSVHDLSGRLIKTLVSRACQAGLHGYIWNATDSQNRTVAAGIYFYRLKAGPRVLMKRVVLAK